MPSIATSIDNDLDSKINDSIIGINHFRDQILIIDGEKEIYNNAISNIDRNLLEQIDDINNYLVGVQSAYQERVNVGCRTDIFWQVVGVDTTVMPYEYSITATKLTLNGYPITGITTVGLGTTGTVIATKSGISTVDDLYGWQEDNLYGLKYYDEPYTRDIGDTSVATFIGTCAFGTKNLIVMLPYEDGISNDFEVGQVVTCSTDGIFAGNSNTIVGLGTTTADLSKVSPGIGTTNATVPVIVLNVNTIGVVTAPQADGSFITFTVLDDPDNIGSISDYEVGFTKNPFSPQQIGILESSSQIGIGISIYLDNSGNPSATQSWKPENAITGVEDVDDVVEPSVGAGKIYYKVGFTSAPSTFGGASRAPEGTTLIGITEADMISYFIDLSTCSTEETAISNSITARNSAESNFNSGISTFNSLLSAARDLRSERSDYNLRIWGLRQSIGKQTEIINRQRALKNVVGITTIRGVIQ